MEGSRKRMKRVRIRNTVLVLGKFGSVQVFALFFSTPNQTGVPFGGSFDLEVWINLKKTQTGLRVQFGVWQKRA